MRLSVNYLRRALWAPIVLMWIPMAAWAATVSEAPVFEGVDWSVLALAFGISTLSGATALVWRIDRELRTAPDGKLPRPWLFVLSNALGSWTAGALAWLISQSQGVSVYPTMVVVILLSFGGASAIEKLAEKYINREGPLT